MYSRHTTPPVSSYNYIPGSVGSDVTYYSQESSPAPNVAPTPPRSPVRQLGPTLLPKVRTQDQVAEPTAGPIRHRRTTSAASNVSYGYSPYARPASQSYREPSPYTHNDLISPVSNNSCDFNGLSMLNSPISFTQSQGRRASSYAPTHSRSSSVNASRHVRSTSANSIDESTISRYGFPTYRNLPNYVTAPSAPQPEFITAPVTYSQVQQPPSYAATALDFPLLDFEPAPAVQYPSFTEQQPSFDAYQPVATSSLLDYLSAPNPSPALVRRVTAAPRGINNHFWWDIRNLRSWEDFNIAAIKEIPSVLPLLEVPVSQSYLPQPIRQNMQPETESALHDICTNYYANKVNAALKIAQGNTHMQMRAIKPAPGARTQPEFVSSYSSDFEKTLFGDARGRVVGLVKCYDNWNTGMRSESAPKQVLYLQGLAHLQRVMREHGCRYGFIMTEIELLCVRAGGDSNTPDPTTFNAAAGMPIFGYLELSAPISLSTSGMSANGDIQLTASLALWYLHMLAKENPFEGMGTWRMEVGGPAALTRQNHLEKDAWIPKPQLGEKREAKRVRGWVFPDEPLSKRECGKGRRGKSVG
ncbi:hypothetical protein SLS59_002843 [Nothophoma quercina]|uniref:Sialidase n=1 Tax=Nothophoma quercina TaxID=749835 RepID=A0ABR3RSR5_9PLEO